MLFSHGVQSVGVVPLERWRGLLQRAREKGGFVGVDEARYPRDFASLTRYHTELPRLITARHPPPGWLALERLDAFLAQTRGRHDVRWVDDPVEQPRAEAVRKRSDSVVVSKPPASGDSAAGAGQGGPLIGTARPRGPSALLPCLWKAERLWTPRGSMRFHARVALRDAPPHAPAVVLVHGIGVSSRYMTPTLWHLAPFCRAYAPDLPGFGLTTRPKHALELDALADALAMWMQAAGVGRASVLANSMGCQTAVRFALRHPERLDKLILQGPTVDPEARGALRQVGRWLRNAPREPPTLGALLLLDYRDAGPLRILRTSSFALKDRMEDLLPQVPHPTLVVRGAKDPTVPGAWTRRMVELLPHGRLVTIPGAAHTLNYDAPLELVRVVRPFLEQGRPNDISERPHA